jgi:hypothetical protein
MEYYPLIKRNELIRHKKTCRSLKSILVSERSQSEKAIYCMIPALHQFLRRQ